MSEARLGETGANKGCAAAVTPLPVDPPLPTALLLLSTQTPAYPPTYPPLPTPTHLPTQLRLLRRLPHGFAAEAPQVRPARAEESHGGSSSCTAEGALENTAFSAPVFSFAVSLARICCATNTTQNTMKTQRYFFSTGCGDICGDVGRLLRLLCGYGGQEVGTGPYIRSVLRYPHVDSLPTNCPSHL